MSKTFQWDGVDEFGRFLRETPGIVVRDVEAALYQEAENIMGVSVRNTPVKDRYLAGSAHVKLPETKRGKTTVTLAYGTEYAVYVHESGPRKGGPGGKKFLEYAVKDNAKGMSDRMRRRVLARIGRRL